MIKYTEPPEHDRHTRPIHLILIGLSIALFLLGALIYFN